MTNMHIKLLVVALVVSIMMLSGASIYTSVISAGNHNRNCASRNLTLNAVQNIIEYIIPVAKRKGPALALYNFSIEQLGQARC